MKGVEYGKKLCKCVAVTCEVSKVRLFMKLLIIMFFSKVQLKQNYWKSLEKITSNVEILAKIKKNDLGRFWRSFRIILWSNEFKEKLLKAPDLIFKVTT